MRLRRVGAGLALGAALAVLLAPAAGADPARPGNYRSHVEWIKPSTNAMTAKVVGGDGFLDVKVRPGHIMTIPGYTGEPWLRIDAKGVVQENQGSSATYLNQTRFGTAANVEIPDWVSIKNATEHPKWKTVGHNGHYVWHDHRIHYMTPQTPPPLVPGTNRVAIGIRDDGRWVVPITADGHATQIVGELRVYTAPSPAPQWALAGVLFVALAALGLIVRGPTARVGAGTLVIAGALATWAGASEMAAVPRLAGGNPIWVALPAICVVAALGALALRSAVLRSIAILAAAAALGVWAILRIPAFDKAVPLGNLSPALTRLIAAGSLGVAAGSIVVAIASGGLSLRLPDLDLPDGTPDSTVDNTAEE